jgi:hypothetical protein
MPERDVNPGQPNQGPQGTNKYDELLREAQQPISEAQQQAVAGQVGARLAEEPAAETKRPGRFRRFAARLGVGAVIAGGVAGGVALAAEQASHNEPGGDDKGSSEVTPNTEPSQSESAAAPSPTENELPELATEYDATLYMSGKESGMPQLADKLSAIQAAGNTSIKLIEHNPDPYGTPLATKRIETTLDNGTTLIVNLTGEVKPGASEPSTELGTSGDSTGTRSIEFVEKHPDGSHDDIYVSSDEKPTVRTTSADSDGKTTGEVFTSKPSSPNAKPLTRDAIDKAVDDMENKLNEFGVK